jgi:DNA-binding transcriptional LysR family regulator
MLCWLRFAFDLGINPLIELRHLRYFVAVAEELSFRIAAQRLNVSQPPLSRQIQALENELGLRLLKRDRRSRVALTDAGHVFLMDARQTLANAARAPERAREAAAGKRGRLKIANIAALSVRVLPGLLCAFREEFPEVEVSLVEMKRGEPLPALREGRIHLAIFPDLGKPLDREFQSQPLFSCPMVAVLPAGHDLARDANAEIRVEALAGETLLTPATQASPGYFDRLNQLCALTHFTPAAAQSVDGFHNIMGMVAAGYGVSILPEVLVSSPGPACSIRRLSAPVPKFELKLFWLRKAQSLVLQNFLAVAKEGCPPETIRILSTRGGERRRAAARGV